YFEGAIIETFLSRCTDGLFRQLAAILYCYAEDGSELAKKALHAKYNYFAAKKGRLAKSAHEITKNSDVNEGMQWDEIVYHLFWIDGFDAFKRYATDVGEVQLKNPNDRKSYNGWYIRRAENMFGKERIDSFFAGMTEKSEAIKTLKDTLESDELAYKERKAREEQQRITVSDLLKAAKEAATGKNPRREFSFRIRLSFAKYASESDIIELTQTILREENETVKALLLNTFRRTKTVPMDVTQLMEYAQSENELLAEVAINRLEEYKDKRLHDLAIQLLKTKGLKSFASSLLIKNYKKSDNALIAELIKKSASIPHHVQQEIRDIYEHHHSADAFPTLLRVYQKGDCSFCRNGIVEAMNHCGVLTDEILNECLYDFNDDTRRYAKRLISRRNSKRSPLC
ncbi:MAG: hypothetical protein FWF44_04185, partial [Defluviitaleaceae bacterium]|nr:hypothetical protein [Defluviitaleaceae bacterium]